MKIKNPDLPVDIDDASLLEMRDLMSPKILQAGEMIFWFHSYDAIHENRASVHVGIGSQNDKADAKIWLEPNVEVAKHGHTLKSHELNQALKIINENRDYLLEEWYGYSEQDNR